MSDIDIAVADSLKVLDLKRPIREEATKGVSHDISTWLFDTYPIHGSRIVAVTSAGSAELKVLTPRAIATVLEVVGPQFEQATGNKLNVVTGFGPNLVSRVDTGEPFDLLVGTPPMLDKMIKAGKLKANSYTLLVGTDTAFLMVGPSPSLCVAHSTSSSSTGRFTQACRCRCAR